jgi:endonuclease YncB( thermonuclease family)
MVKNGFAKAYTRFPFFYKKDFIQAEVFAKEKKI